MRRTRVAATSKRALVTGGAGFMGSHVAERCLELGFEVTVVDNLSGGFERNAPKGARFLRGDLCDASFVDSLWSEQRYDYVYHLAAYGAEGLSHFVRRFNYETNLLSSIHLINNAVRREASSFVFTSSIAVYGASQVPMREEMRLDKHYFGRFENTSELFRFSVSTLAIWERDIAGLWQRH